MDIKFGHNMISEKSPKGAKDIYLGNFFQEHLYSEADYSITEENDMAFEIRLCEALLASDPCNIEALNVLGQDYTTNGDYEKGLEIDIRLSRLLPSDPLVHYNLACSYSLLNHIDESITSLSKSIELGYEDINYMLNDPDLENAKRDPRFEKLTGSPRSSR